MFRRSDFKKLELLGQGKKNTKIYKVEHIKTNKIYALKEIEAKSLEKLNEYKEEAVQLSKAQNHPNILHFHGYYFYETPHNTFKLGIICEYINEGDNLEIMYRKRETKKQYWNEEAILKMSYSLIDALAFLQSIGICHRDIKPANLFLVDTGEIKIIDFGESKESFQEDSNEDDTNMATIRGTPQYLSPILWAAHVLNPGQKQAEHNLYKSDVFSAGLVLFQMASMKDVTGFNQKTEKTNGERLIKEGLSNLGKKFSNKVIDLIKAMLSFDEEIRPTFIDLAKSLFGENYDFKNRSDIQKGGSVAAVKKEKSDEEKRALFSRYKEQQNLNFNMNKITYWFEYGGNTIAKFYLNKDDDKWKLVGKYRSEFPSHFTIIFIDEDIGHFLIGGIENVNLLQYRDAMIIKKSSMNIERSFAAICNIKNIIFAIGGYDYSEKNQLKSIEIYDIDKDKWHLNVYEDLKVARSQSSALVFNTNLIYVFGGYNKTSGTLNSIETINVNKKTTTLLEIKLPIPLRRFASLKIAESRIMIFGGITRLCKETSDVYCLDIENSKFINFAPLPKAGIIEHEVLLDEIGNVNIFIENNYGTSPPVHCTYTYLDYNN